MRLHYCISCTRISVQTLDLHGELIFCINDLEIIGLQKSFKMTSSKLKLGEV